MIDLKPLAAPPSPPVCTENLNPDGMTVESAEQCVRADGSDPLNRAIGWRIFVPRPARSDVLDNSRYRFAGSGAWRATMTARVGGRAQWLVLDGFALAVGESPKGPAFEVDTSNSEVTSFLCEPSLLTVSVPLAAHLGECVATKPLPPARQSFPPVVAMPGTQPGWGMVAGPAVAGKSRLSLPNFSVHLLRREDMLSLDLLLYNVALEGGGGTSCALVQKDTTQPAYFVVRFNAPQNFGEQAIFEASDDGGQTLIAEDARPFVEWKIGCYDRRPAFVTLAEDLEEQFHAGLRERHISEFVNDDQFDGGELRLEFQETPLVVYAVLQLGPDTSLSE